jgi:hypothetical protein
MTVPPRAYKNYAEFKASFKEEYDNFVLPADCAESGPEMGPTLSGPPRAPWKLQWWLIFNDSRFISCAEYYEPRSGNAEIGYLTQFSYHYGVHPRRTDLKGRPKHSTTAGTILRIDWAPDYKDHIHFRGVDHIAQRSLSGNFVILEMTMFDFVNRIIEHRRTNNPLDECFGFEVI